MGLPCLVGLRMGVKLRGECGRNRWSPVEPPRPGVFGNKRGSVWRTLSSSAQAPTGSHRHGIAPGGSLHSAWNLCQELAQPLISHGVLDLQEERCSSTPPDLTLHGNTSSSMTWDTQKPCPHRGWDPGWPEGTYLDGIEEK